MRSFFTGKKAKTKTKTTENEDAQGKAPEVQDKLEAAAAAATVTPSDTPEDRNLGVSEPEVEDDKISSLTGKSASVDNLEAGERGRLLSGGSVSSCRSSSDEEELLHSYDHFEYNGYPGDGGSEGAASRNGSRDLLLSDASSDADTKVADHENNLKSEKSLGGYDAEDELEGSLSAKSKKKLVTLKDFGLIRVLGKGAFAKVLEVEKAGSGTRYAMKVLKKHHVKRKNQVEHTRTERRVLARVSHPFICHLRYAFQTRQKLYLILDYHPGGELFYHLSRRGRFREHQVLVYAAEISMALGYLHDKDIVYRDLKPENILIQADGHIALTDFGLAKDNVQSFTTGAKSFCGTPEYLAPEIIHRKGHGKAVDWWSLGMMIYELLTGLPPWYTKNRLHLFEDICWAPLRFPRHVSDIARSLIRGMICRDPSQRFTAKEVKQHIFFETVDWELAMKRGLKPPIVPIPGTAYTSREVRKLPLESQGQDRDAADAESEDGSRSSSPFEGFSFEGMSANRDALSQSVDYTDADHLSNTEAARLASAQVNKADADARRAEEDLKADATDSS